MAKKWSTCSSGALRTNLAKCEYDWRLTWFGWWLYFIGGGRGAINLASPPRLLKTTLDHSPERQNCFEKLSISDPLFPNLCRTGLLMRTKEKGSFFDSSKFTPLVSKKIPLNGAR